VGPADNSHLFECRISDDAKLSHGMLPAPLVYNAFYAEEKPISVANLTSDYFQMGYFGQNGDSK
jgi:hypothetical protein